MRFGGSGECEVMKSSCGGKDFIAPERSVMTRKIVADEMMVVRTKWWWWGGFRR